MNLGLCPFKWSNYMVLWLGSPIFFEIGCRASECHMRQAIKSWFSYAFIWDFEFFLQCSAISTIMVVGSLYLATLYIVVPTFYQCSKKFEFSRHKNFSYVDFKVRLSFCYSQISLLIFLRKTMHGNSIPIVGNMCSPTG